MFDVCVCYADLLNRFDPRAFRWALTMKLAVEEINQSTQLLPNYTLGYKIFDSCAYPLTGQRAAVAVLNGISEEESPTCSDASLLLAVIGESGSAQSIVVSRILQPFRIPMVILKKRCSMPLPYTKCWFGIYPRYFVAVFVLLCRLVTFLHVLVSLTEEVIQLFLE